MAAFDDELPHLLFAAFAEVPGPTAVGTRIVQLISAFSDDFDVDAMSLKGRELAHIQRLGTARMLRVPVEEKTFFERLGAYTRALGRQLAGDVYQLVYCADVFSAQVAAAYRESVGFTLVLDASDLPSESFGARYPVDDAQAEGKPPPDPIKLKTQWRDIEKHALRAADVVVVSSRHAARELSERVDARRLMLMPRAVDRTLFAPPTVEVPDQRRRAVLVVGARAEGGEQERSIALLYRLVGQLPDDVEVVLAGQGHRDSEELDRLLEGTALHGRVRRIDLDGPARLVNALARADVVVVPGRPTAGATPLAIPHRVLEAMACGRAVVLAGGGAPLQGMLEPDQDLLVTGAILEPADAEPVADAVLYLLEDQERRAAMGRAGLKHVAEHADLGQRIEDFAKLISERLGVTMRPRGPESTMRAEPTEPTGAGDAPAPAPVSMGSAQDLPMVSDVQLVQSADGAHQTVTPPPRLASMSDSGAARPVNMERFSADRLLSEEGDALDEAGSDPWGGDTELEAAEAAPVSPTPAGSRQAPRSGPIPRSFSTETDRRGREGLSDLPADPLADGHEARPTSTFDRPHTAEQSSSDNTQIGGEAAREVLRAERELAKQNSTAVVIGPELDTESAQYGDLIPGVTDPKMQAGTESGLSPSALASLEAGSDDSQADPWAPDTVFDARPVFHSGEQSGGDADPGGGEEEAKVPAPPAPSTGEGAEPDAETTRNPVSRSQTRSTTRPPEQPLPSRGSLLVDDDEDR